MPKLVSIIIPNYNHAAFLQQRLDSVFQQTYQNFEVILLDDASTDGSVEILNTYKDHPQVSHLVINETNSGSPFKQWQKGIQLAKGEYIWIAESDDKASPQFLEMLVPLLNQPKVVLCYSATEHIDEINNSKYMDTWAFAMDQKRWLSNYINNGTDEINRFFRYRNIIPNASAALFLKSAVNLDEIPVKMKYCGDWFFWISLLNKGDIAYLSKTLNFYRKHQATTRMFQDKKIEAVRFKEYFSIVCRHNSFWGRICELEKYEWISLECYLKKRTIGAFPNLKLRLPLDFQINYLKIVLKRSL